MPATARLSPPPAASVASTAAPRVGSSRRPRGARLDVEPAGPTCGSDPRQAMETVVRRLHARIGDRSYAMWFERSAKFDLREDGGALSVAVPNRFVADWIDRNYKGQLADVAGEAIGRDVSIAIRIDATAFDRQDTAAPTAPALRAGAARPTDRADATVAPRRRRPTGTAALLARRGLRHRLEQFVVGPSNELAYNASQRLAREAIEGARSASPLFLHGGCGLGKTHLLRGLVERAARLRPDAKVLYTTGEQFTNQYIDALRHGKLDAFRRQVRGLDLLAVDDVHFLARKEKTQEEFLHCFDELHLSGGRVVLASDQHPKLIDALSEKLVSRCVSGLVVQLHPPDPQTRLALVQQLAKRRGLVLAPGIDEAVAGRCLGSVRELAGLMHRLHALATLGTPDGKPAGGSPSVGHALLSRLAQQDASAAPPRPIRIEEVLDSVCQYLGVHPDQVRGRGRQRPIVLARQLTVYLAKRLTHMSYPEIARALGRSNHSTVITADQRMDRQYDANQPQQLPGRTEPVGSVELVERLRREVMQHR